MFPHILRHNKACGEEKRKERENSRPAEGQQRERERARSLNEAERETSSWRMDAPEMLLHACRASVGVGREGGSLTFKT